MSTPPEIKQPKLAIVVPVYNVARYLRECLDSLLAQTNPNFVVYAVDDGSTDESGAILDEYAKKDARIRVIHQKNGGLSAARNSALDAIEKDGSFDFVAFVDSDDKVLPRYLSTLVDAAVTNRADVAQCGFYLFNDKGETKKPNRPQKETLLSNTDFLKCVFTTTEFRKTHFCGGYVWNKLFSASVVRGIRFPLDRAVMEDELFALQAGVRAKLVAYLPDQLYAYRKRFGSLLTEDDSPVRNFEGRCLCVDFAEKHASSDIHLICVAAWAQRAVSLFKKARLKPTEAMRMQKELVLRAVDSNLINQKIAKQFIFFCDRPSLIKPYSLLRQLWKKKRAVDSLK